MRLDEIHPGISLFERQNTFHAFFLVSREINNLTLVDFVGTSLRQTKRSVAMPHDTLAKANFFR